jgi:hypothetical protein
MIATANIESTATALPKAAYVIHYHRVSTISEYSVVKAELLTAMDGSCVKYLS